jgi:hypothetical protein
MALMAGFAERTGLSAERPRRRYLWTDAFAVCNLLGLAGETGEERLTRLALQLVDQVHHTLGRHRGDDGRTGWISGLGERDGETHPTLGGLRIGKGLPEREADDPFDERLEWDRDGQYFHYLTKWMHALDQLARATAQARFSIWARELAQTAHRAFTYLPAEGATARRLYWKMSIDLSRPLVHSMGQHDPLDGYVTCLRLRATARALPGAAGGPDLDGETRSFAAMLDPGQWATADPLGIGGLLTDAWRVERLIRERALSDSHLLEALLTAALAGLQHYARTEEHRLPADYRLAFRELGLSTGLRAVERLWKALDSSPHHAPGPVPLRTLVQALRRYAPLGEAIEAFWRDAANRSSPAWSEHCDINEVMLATSLAPEGFLEPAPLG